MQASIGEIIRQLRHLRNMTQLQLAGDRFSKSYVSAVERNRIAPSPRALRFFAQRLGQPNGNFAALLQQPDVAQALSALDTPALPVANGHITRDDTITLLNMLLAEADFAGFAFDRHVPTLTREALASLPQQVQARYYFLLGLDAKERGQLAVALRAFESALALAPAHQQASILDEMGSCSFLLQAYHTALGYHLHALHVLSNAPPSRTSASLQLAVELHCGNSYRALAAYKQALAHYESARTQLSAQHDLATAGELYSGLGYCIYAAIYPSTAPPAHVTSSINRADAGLKGYPQGAALQQASLRADAINRVPTDMASEGIEHAFQKATGFLLQSRSFYQVSGDRAREANVRLMLASVLLDFSTWRRRMIAERASDTEQRQTFMDCTRLLDDAAEQCQQVLLGWQDQLEHPPHPVDAINRVPTTLDTQLYVALACLVRVSVQRAILARLEGSSLDVAYRQRAFAAYMCQQVLDTLANPSLLRALIQQAVTVSADTLAYRSPSLPRLIETAPDVSDSSPRSPLSLVKVYIAMGEVAEELGRVAPVSSYAHDCYTQANQSFQAALSLAHAIHVKGERDPGYLARLYQHYIALLEERALASPALAEETTKALLGVLKDAFWL
jgi:tetratricopeptide (TPR) repeat protein